MRWKIVVHQKALEEIDNLPVEMRAKLARLLEIIQSVGPLGLCEPYAKSLGQKLWEIRLRGKDGIARVIYVALSNQTVGILHAFIKKTQKTPKQALDCAKKRLKEL
ncbi:type II toxin-antitoxin system RelE/ParE family toxin [Candidatus Finniella inopinata]|uniref:Type II toxin-antitoxin system RelE/ParE family toxin n=1 Tax=Candidatus Finniella inopinata TaxID=1696036 RepID=A0A4Q7DKU8_9PROT|nr:type II toxin-antitoxin system RelE/ParE family toxin [Candidatus Finniella inopinata]RZI46959.1 type II toxin-antitoxin system RelE/ParE family toxin [Candidatus Finniella inopinata]